MRTKVPPGREPSAWESAVLKRLIDVSEIANDLARQIDGARVQLIVQDDDNYGSVKLVLDDASQPSPLGRRIVAEGEAKDIDGIPIYLLLHMVDGKLHELEIYKADGSRMVELPVPEEFTYTRGSP
ncbi:hypothetical protein AYO38_07545 [bacterium SCGC AG-212-C10]|nr:hypothetical protein AYO38_07545 [bacterium SCGC AG-212-C10]